MQKHFYLFFLALLSGLTFTGQNWKLKLNSNVELRTWKLTDRVDKEEKALGGASIRLLNGSNVVAEVSSKPNGDFSIEVPPNGDFTMEVSYAGCNTKRFAVSTKGVPGEVANDNFKPSYSIGGFILSKPLPGIDYSTLKNPLLKVYYISGAKKFDNDEDITDRGLKTVSKLADAENQLAEKFCALNKSGDAALAKGDCPTAKSNYEKAIALLPGEMYPANQLPKVGDCLKQKDATDKKAIDDALAKVAADKAAREKEESEKLIQAQAEAAKKQAEREKAEEGKKKKEQVKETPKTESVKTEAPKETSPSAPTVTVTKGPIKIKDKSAEQLEREAKEAKQREGMAKSAQEDRDAMRKDEEKARDNYKKQQEKEAERRQKEREGKAAAEAKIIEEDKAEAARIEERRQKEREGKAAAEAKIIEEDKAEAAKREERRQKQWEEDEKRRKEELEERRKASENMELEEGDHHIPQPLGADKYKDCIKAADELFKMKRYAEAKKKYEEALTYKANDTYATSRLTEIAAKLQPK